MSFDVQNGVSGAINGVDQTPAKPEPVTKEEKE